MDVAAPLQPPLSGEESSQLTSLPSSSSAQSLDVGSTIRASRTKTTYSRKSGNEAAAAEERFTIATIAAASSSLPSSPTEACFDTPMRPHGRDGAKQALGATDEEDPAELTVTTDVSPGSQPGPATMKEKHDRDTRVSRETPSPSPSPRSDDEPALRRKRFQFGLSKTIYDSGSDSETRPEDSVASPAHSAKADVLSRARSDSSHQSPFGFVDEEDPVVPRKAGKILAMRGKNGKASRNRFASDEESGDDLHDRVNKSSSKRDRAFRIHSSSGSVPDTNPTPSRRDKMEALAAKARSQKQIDVAETFDEPLVEADFMPVRASRSMSPIDAGSDGADHDDAMPTFRHGKRVSAKSRPKAKPKAKVASPDILGDFDNKQSKANHAKTEAPPKMKPPSKKEQETMHRETARLDREHRARLAPAPKKQLNLQELLQRISSSKPETSSSASPAPDSGFVSSDPPSSLIPSAQSRSQHRSSQLKSDPIESDPIRDRSSPNQLSSPVVAMTKQQERRLGFNTSNKASALRTAAPTTGAASDVQGNGSDNDSEGDLPEVSDMLEANRLRTEKDDRYAAYQALKLQRFEAMKKQKAIQEEEQDNELDVYQPVHALARQQNRLPTTPGPKRPADQIFRNLGMQTTPSRSVHRGTNEAGSPNAITIDDLDADETLLVTDSKSFGQPSEQAAERNQTGMLQNSQAKSRPNEEVRPSRKARPTQLTTAEFNATIAQKMQAQARQARAQKEAKARTSGASKRSAHTDDDETITDGNDIQMMIDQLNAQQAVGNKDIDDEAHNSEDEIDSDYNPAGRNDAAIGLDSDAEMVEMGSASEDDYAVDDDDGAEPIDFSDDERVGAQEHEIDADDSEKENAPPPSSQQSQHSRAALHPSPTLSRRMPPSRAVIDDDEDEVARPRVARRGRPSAVVDDEDDDLVSRAARFDQSQDRVPLGDISSQSMGHLAGLPRSNSSSPAITHAPVPARTTRPDKELFPGPEGADEDSFCTNDIPSEAGNGLSQFFKPTMPAPTNKAAAFASQPKTFWDHTQNSMQSQTPQQTVQRRGLDRDDSANSALGAFFNDTQQESTRGESLDVFENHRVPGGKALGFTQLFNDCTPPNEPASALEDVWDASTMPPPKSKDIDAFAALRRAQMGEAMEMLDPTPSALPTLDESQAEREAYAFANANAQRNAPRSPEKMYLNKEGFFTQTKPTGSQAQWTQNDSQSQSQGQDHTFSSLRQSPASLSRNIPNPFSASLTPLKPLHSAARAADRSEDEDDVLPVRKLKRLRRGAITSDAEAEHAENSNDTVDDEDEAPPSSQNSTRSRNAFDVLQFRSRLDHAELSRDKPKARKSAFIEGEAEESEDEELNGNQGAGGLHGVFADEGGNPAGSGDEDDDEDDADAEDMEDLVDNEKELDEAEKDGMVIARYRIDQDEQEKRDIEVHRRAAEGGLRKRRGRGAGLGALDDILDDEADDEEDRRRARMAPGVRAWKKRKVEGDEDGMDALAANEDAKAFVQGYQDTHMVDHELERYDFLVAPTGPNDADSDEDEDGDGDEDIDMREASHDRHQAPSDDDDEADVFGPTKTLTTMNYDQVRSELRDRRQARKRDIIIDDEEDDAGITAGSTARRPTNDWDSDEEEADRPLTAILRDRTKGAINTDVRADINKHGTPGRAKNGPPAKQYGRQGDKRAPQIDAGDIAATDQFSSVGNVDDDDDDDDDNGDVSLFDRIARGASKQTKRSTPQFNDALEDAEPEWGNDANIIRAPRPSTTSGSQMSKSTSSSRLGTTTNLSARKSAARSSSLLLGKQSIMRRESGFSSSSGQ